MKSVRILYFAYGANLDIRSMELRCPGHRRIGRAVLKDYRLMFKGVADVEPAHGHQVHGALYEITPEHLHALDRFEGYPRLYIRRQVQVVTDEDATIQATIYQMSKRDGYSPPLKGYLNTILSGCRQWGIPEEYIQTIIGAAAASHFGGY